MVCVSVLVHFMLMDKLLISTFRINSVRIQPLKIYNFLKSYIPRYTEAMVIKAPLSLIVSLTESSFNYQF